MKKRALFLFILIVWFSWISHGFALEKATHMLINQQVAERTINGFSLNSYLINTLGFDAGIDKELSGYSETNNKYIERPVWWWIQEGGKAEDEPDGLLRMVVNRGRSNNHFHNPLKPNWDTSGLDVYMGPLHYTGQSSILWAQNPNQDPGGKLSWHDARDYFYRGLILTSKTERDRAMAYMFRSLGQLMHLIQDSSVPAHGRNDIHIGFHYEKWLETISRVEPGIFNDFIANPISFDSSILNGDPDFRAPIPIAKIVDSHKYYGRNPDDTANTTAIGLAEYVNANFFSENTIFNNAFPYPARTSVEKQDYLIPDPRDNNRTVMRQYYNKIGDGDTGYRLATVGLLRDYITKHFPWYRGLEGESLDGGVYEDYARRLLPRAVGYSSGLLKYFFRGKFQVTAIPIFYRGEIHFMRLKIKNLADETMSNGNFALTYRYTPPGGNTDGSDDIFMRAWALDGSPFVSCPELRAQNEMVVDFLIHPPLPRKDYVAINFTLAFKGTLGSEVGAVIGKSFDPGWVIFEEEWDKELPGNYDWAHTEYNWSSLNPNNGLTVNKIEEDLLVKENIRHGGFQLSRVNESFLGHEVDGRFKGPFPLSITPNTYIMYKIDEMSVNPLGAGYQIMLLSFTNRLALQISQDGQFIYWNPTTGYYTFNPGQIIVDNIYELFQRVGITIPEPFQIIFLGLDQRLYELEDPAAGEHIQRMKVDFIRIVEGKVQ